jgi:hypothetical protein
VVPGWRASLAWLWLAGATAGCLLFTDRINSVPAVTIKAPAQMFAGTSAMFEADARDPDGDAVTLVWRYVYGTCDAVVPSQWAEARGHEQKTLSVMVTARQPFCVRVEARDVDGAEAAAMFPAVPTNRLPSPMISATSGQGGGNLPLFSMVRFDAGASIDQDGDELSFRWNVTVAGGAAVATTDCGAAPKPRTAQCFLADRPGEYTAIVEVSDDGGTSWAAKADARVNVGPDRPPCVAATFPTIGPLVMGVADPARVFEVLRVRDDGHPYPDGDRPGLKFVWSVTRKTGASWEPWMRALGHDLATFPVGAGVVRFEDVRPGSEYKVRVEPRDPERVRTATTDLAECTEKDPDVCEQPGEPEPCRRWVTWRVTFR